jgi:adenylate cyclase
MKTYAFGAFRLDPGARRLLRDGAPVTLKPKAFDLLLSLVENRGRLVSKDELLRRVWPDTVVDESSLTQNVYELRRALGDPRSIENVSRRGYRFVGEVTVAGAIPQRTSVAVLPFRAAPAEELLAFGIVDALITVLSSVRGLVVRPLSSISRYGGADALTAARELGVALAVDGSVQVAGERMRVTVTLLDVSSGEVRWARRFDERTSDLFALQDAIAGQLGEAIAPHLERDEHDALTRRSTASAEAYKLYRAGRHHWSKATPEALWKAIDAFRAAIALDPRYALAWVGLADAYTSLDWYGVLSTRDSNPHARAAAETALEIDDGLAEGHASLAMARQYAWDWDGAESEYRAALALQPNYAQAHQWYGVFLSFLGRHDEALREVRRAHELDPVSPSIGSQVALVLICARRYDESAAQVRLVLDLEPGALEALFYLAMIHALQGDFEESIAIARDLPPDNPDFRAVLAHALGRAGEREEAREIIAGLHAIAGGYRPLLWMAIAHLGLDDHDAALTCLERACDDPDDSLVAVKVFPMFDPIRDDPRFVAVLRRMGLDA